MSTKAMYMFQSEPISLRLKDGTHVLVNQLNENEFEFHLTRLNSEKHNFIWKKNTDEIEESYETRFDNWQHEAIDLLKSMQNKNG